MTTSSTPGMSPAGILRGGAHPWLARAALRARRIGWGVVLAAGGLLAAGVAAPARPQENRPAAALSDSTGVLEGRVLDGRTGRPLRQANVVVTGTRTGTITDERGGFVIDWLTAGTYTLAITYIGYEDRSERVEVQPGQASPPLTLRLIPTVVATLDAIEVRGERPVIDVQSTSSAHTMLAQEIESLIARSPTLDEVVAQQPGVTREEGRLHFRGGRADENLFMIDGIGIRDLLSGDSDGSQVSARSASRVNVVTGGMSARYGQAMSGVIDTQIKEGGQRWHGSVSYDTDALIDPRGYHLLHLELEGPNRPVEALLRALGSERPSVTFYGNVGCELSNTYKGYVYNPTADGTLRSSLHDEVFGQEYRYGSFFYPSASNDWRGVLKTSWKATANDKFSMTWTKNLGFGHDWGEPDIGDIDRNASNFPWAWANHLDGHYTVSRDFNLMTAAWNRTLGLNTQTSVQLWREYSGQHKDVLGKHYGNYNHLRDADLLEDPSFYDTPYFIDVGDAPDWRDRYAMVWGLKNDWSYRWRGHSFQAGLSGEYQDVQYMQLNALAVHIDPDNPNNNRPLGDEFDLFHVTPNVGNAYLQDSFEHEGLVVNAGLVYDWWFPGRQVEKAMAAQALPHMTPELQAKYRRETHGLFGYRYKGHLSPRVGISFPIGQRAHLFFNYSHNSQRPPYYYVYAKSSSQSGEEYPRIGNPTLNPKISVAYEIGTGYEFTKATAAKATLFWKDMYDYPTSIRLVMQERPTSRSNFFMYWNADYARSRGIELLLERSLQNFLAGNVSYTYTTGKGKSSDPNKTKLIQEIGGDSREPLLGEEYLWWNRPHKLTARADLRIREKEDPPRWFGFAWPRDFSIGVHFMIRSGRAYTPVNLAGLPVGAPYSRNGPYDSTCDISVRKGFRLSRRRFEVSFRVYNLFDHRTPVYFDAVTGKPYKPGRGSLSYGFDNPENYDDALLAAYSQTQTEPSLHTLKEEFYAAHGRLPTNWDLIEIYRGLSPVADTIEAAVDHQFQAAAFALHNPAYFDAPRTFRVGISYEW